MDETNALLHHTDSGKEHCVGSQVSWSNGNIDATVVSEREARVDELSLPWTTEQLYVQ